VKGVLVRSSVNSSIGTGPLHYPVWTMRRRARAAEARGRRGGAAAPVGASPAGEVEALPGDPNFMASLARGLAVIRAFSQNEPSRTISQISQRTGIPRAAVRRCLYTLARLGYVASSDRRFSLRPKILALGHAYLASARLGSTAQPFLDDVNAAVHEASSLAVLDEDEILYVARSVTSARIMSIDLRPGSRLPAYCTSMGRVLLAHLPPADLKAYLSRVRLEALTERTTTSREKLLQILEGIRRNGYAIVDQELEIGLRSIAVPVKDTSGRVVAAMNVGTQAARVPRRDMEARILPRLRAAAEELSALLMP
jgi:IclR family pca regulon transcriptional regulator